MGLLAVIGPSTKEKRGPPALRETRFAKACVSSQKRRTSSSWAGKSTLLATGLYTRTSGLGRGQRPRRRAAVRPRDATGDDLLVAASGVPPARHTFDGLGGAARAVWWTGRVDLAWLTAPKMVTRPRSGGQANGSDRVYQVCGQSDWRGSGA